MHRRAIRVLALFVAVSLQLASGALLAQESASVVASRDFSATVDHPLVPLSTISTRIYAGEEVDERTWQRIATRVEERVLARPEHIAGIDVTIVDVADYHNGELHDRTADYFAQSADGTVYYLGERVDEYGHGKSVDRDESWLAGDRGIEPGVFMPAKPVVGEIFAPERVSDSSLEQATVIASEESVTTVAGTFVGCLVVKEVRFPEGTAEQKTYCPDVGLVREDFVGGYLELVAFGPISATVSPAIPSGWVTIGLVASASSRETRDAR
jgi:hypothetical protein